MKLCVFISLSCLCVSTDADKVTPIQQVIKMMEGMIEQGNEEKHKESKQMAQFKQWCEDTMEVKAKEIAKTEDLIAQLTAEIAEEDALIEKLTGEIDQHQYDLKVDEDNIVAINAVRAGEEKAYKVLSTDYSESVEVLEHAIQVLKEEDKQTAQAEPKEKGKDVFGEEFEAKKDDPWDKKKVLVQVRNLAMVPEETRKAISAFLEDPGLDKSAPEAYAYEFQSGDILQMLKDLHVKFSKLLEETNKEEESRIQAYELLLADLKDQNEQSRKAIDEKTKRRGATQESRAQNAGELRARQQLNVDNRNAVKDATVLCEQKATDYVARQKLRAEELVALAKAIEVMQSPEVSGAGEEHLHKDEFKPAATSLAQLRSQSLSAGQVQAARYLRSMGQELNSKVLSALAVRVEADPFRKVKKMIEELIDRLMDETNAETEHKGWCDKELATNEKTRNEKTKGVTDLTAKKDLLTAELEKRAEEIAEFTTSIKEMTAKIAELTVIRAENKAENEQTVRDAKGGQVGVSKAIEILKVFYAKAADATAMLQDDPKYTATKLEQPEIFDEAYTGMSDAKGGVVGMLEVILSDFERLEADTERQEAEELAEFTSVTNDLKENIAKTTANLKNSQRIKAKQEKELAETIRDLQDTIKELDAAEDYYDKLKPTCIETGVSWQDRVAARKDEMESLRQALKILEEES